MRLFKGHEIKQVLILLRGAGEALNFTQVSDQLKENVPEHVKERAREMAKQELARKLKELNMSMGDAKGYGKLYTAVQSHIARLYDLLESKLHARGLYGHASFAAARC